MKTVAVLMSTYNGENYIKEQIESIFNQKGVIVKLYVRDDGSKDRTLEILKDYNVNLEKGTNIGYIKSFMWLIKNVPFADYYALAIKMMYGMKINYTEQSNSWKIALTMSQPYIQAIRGILMRADIY